MTSCPPVDRCSICGFYFWWFRRDSLHFTSHHELDDSAQHQNTSCNAKQFNVELERLMFCKAIRRNATPFDITQGPFHATLHCLYVRCTNRHNAGPFHATLHCLYVRCTILHYSELSVRATLHRLNVRCAIRHYPEPFQATLHRLVCALCYSILR